MGPTLRQTWGDRPVVEKVSHKKLQVDFGKFVTPAGAEVIETKDNWNYVYLVFEYVYTTPGFCSIASSA